MNGAPRLVEVRQNVLKQNDLVARSLRERFGAAGVYLVSLVSSPGLGKTALVLMSVTEGEDKPLKYPTIFNTSTSRW